jgi:hypothetical protein
VLQLPQILFKENKVIIRILKENLNLKFWIIFLYYL